MKHRHALALALLLAVLTVACSASANVTHCFWDIPFTATQDQVRQKLFDKGITVEPYPPGKWDIYAHFVAASILDMTFAASFTEADTLSFLDVGFPPERIQEQQIGEKSFISEADEELVARQVYMLVNIAAEWREEHGNPTRSRIVVSIDDEMKAYSLALDSKTQETIVHAFMNHEDAYVSFVFSNVYISMSIYRSQSFGSQYTTLSLGVTYYEPALAEQFAANVEVPTPAYDFTSERTR